MDSRRKPGFREGAAVTLRPTGLDLNSSGSGFSSSGFSRSGPALPAAGRQAPNSFVVGASPALSAGFETSFADGGAGSPRDEARKRRFWLKADPPDLVSLAVVILSIGALLVAIGVVVLIGIGRMDGALGAKLIGGLLGGAALTGLAGIAVRRGSSKRSNTEKKG